MTLILHLSDMHFSSNIVDEQLDLHSNKIVSVLNTYSDISEIIIIISGDLVQSGTKEEYDVVESFLSSLKKGIEISKLSSAKLTVLSVPGNHDVYHEKPILTNTELQKIHKNRLYPEKMDDEIKKLSNYYEFAEKSHQYLSNKSCDKFEFSINDQSISFYLLNSAFFSLKEEEDTGLHFIPSEALLELKQASSDYNFVVMHHSPYSYNVIQKKELLEVFSSNFSLLMLGHEHYEDKESYGEKNAQFFVFRAGAFYNKGWQKSEFSVITISESIILTRTNYIWNNTSQLYERHGNNNYINLRRKRKSRFPITDEFLDYIEKDERRSISTTFENYFIFPRMKSVEFENDDKDKTLKSESDFLSEVNHSKYLYLSGNHGLGKTTLLKHMFGLFMESKFPVLLSADDFTHKKPDRVIKSKFEDIYGSDSSIYEQFIQAEPKDKVLLIDDVDRINSDDFNSFIKQIDKEFDYIILTSTEKIQFDWKESIEVKSDYRKAFTFYKMSPLFKDKRYELVKELVPILKISYADEDELIDNLCNTLDSQKRFVFMSPDFIIQYVEYFCKNIGDLSSNDSNVFSKVFEANLTNALSPHTTGQLNVDKMFGLIASIAYLANQKHEYPIKEETISEPIYQYNKEYDNNVEVRRFIDICLKAKILYETKNGYKFTSKHFYAYFIAKEVLRIYDDTGNTTDINAIINYCCFGINSDILLFIIYISNKIAILNIIIDMLHTLTDTWQEYNGHDINIHFLEKPYEVKKEFMEKERAEIVNEQVMIEEGSDDIKDIETYDIYDYNEDEVDDIVNKMIKATSLLNIISRAFPSFEHRIKTEQKREIVELLYRVPNKIFYTWAKEIDNDCEAYIDYFLQKHDNEYGLDMAVSRSLANLQNMSLSLMLNIYFSVVHEGCKANTFSFFEKFEHDKFFTYQSEFMIMIEYYKKDPRILISLANKQLSLGDKIAEDLTKRILYHAINTLPKLPFSQKDRLASTIGLKKKDIKRIDMNRRKML